VFDAVDQPVPITGEPNPVPVGITFHGKGVEREGVFAKFLYGADGFRPDVFVELVQLPANAGQD
jgi:hypothetical protein